MTTASMNPKRDRESRARKEIKDARNSEIISLYAQGVQKKVIAEKFGMSIAGVYSVLERKGARRCDGKNNVESPLSRFEKKIRITPGCWLWTGGTSAGYGSFSIGRQDILAHRFSYENYVGPIPVGMFILHSCDNPKCVNPDHLRPGTHDDNMRDMSERGRSSSGPGERAPYRKLSEAQVRAIYHDGRMQRVIALDYQVDWSTICDIKHRRTWAHVDMSAITAPSSGIPVSELRQVACMEPATYPHLRARRAA